ncbi:MAG: HAD hydrolase family protein [Pirellulales bacterium]|nr:HAD hydrolase family protein [Pirellulales bacterium]
MSLATRCQRVELFLSDVDGVLTDGGVIFDNQGLEIKRFHIRDGLGIKLWQQAGYRFGIITGRASQIVRVRATELGIDLLRQGVEDKWAMARQMIQELQIRPEQVAYMGDDLPDLPVMRQVGLAIAPADAAREVRNAAHLITELRGGQGAVREALEAVLQAQGRWEYLVQKYQP